MKVFFCLLFALIGLLGNQLLSASADEVHIREGSVLKGKIIEIIPNESYHIQLSGGSVFVVKSEEIDKVIFSLIAPEPHLLYKRFHLGGQGGLFRSLSTDFTARYPINRRDTVQLDASNAATGSLNFRYSLNHLVDFVIDTRLALASDNIEVYGETLTYSATSRFIGAGARYYFVPEIQAVRTFVQGVLYTIIESENVSALVLGWDRDATHTGLGIGINGGFDVRISDLISLSVEGELMAPTLKTDQSGIDNMWGFGVRAGTYFNF